MLKYRVLYQLIAILIISTGIKAFSQEKHELVLAGGCFWCMEAAFDKITGVTGTESGYAGGITLNPTYEEVSSGKSEHLEVIKISYDPKNTNLESLLEAFWQNIDPFNSEGQFCDLGSQYKTAIFYKDENEKQLAQKSLDRRKEIHKQEIFTQILPLKNFTRAEEHHQDYYKKNPLRYESYKYACGRERRLKEISGAALN